MKHPARTYLAAAVALIVVAAIIVVIAITFKPGNAANPTASPSTPTNPDQSLLLTLSDFPDGYVEGSAGTSWEQGQTEPITPHAWGLLPKARMRKRPTLSTSSVTTTALRRCVMLFSTRNA
ncbi:hypothetical protein [Gordonia aichiensis]